VETGCPAAEFKEACAKRGVLVGREFPPLERVHARVSVGTIEEMQQASLVFGEVIGAHRSGAAEPSRVSGGHR